MSQTGLYYRTQLETKVSLLPEQITAEIDDNILTNLKAKVESKLMDSGIVLRVNRLIDYHTGFIDKVNNMGTTVYTVKYECFICSPTKNLEIVCVLENIIKGYLIAKNGPVVIAIYNSNIDDTKFDVKGNDIYYNKKRLLEKGDFLKVSIINIHNNPGERKVVVMCKLIDMANKAEVNIYKEDQRIITNSNADDEKEFI